jgi:tetratricopeptide (TPR) repeat protein
MVQEMEKNGRERPAGKSDEGIPDLSRQIRKVVSRPNDEEIWLTYGSELMYKGDYARASELFSRAITGSPCSARAYACKADSLEKMGKLDEAVGTYEKALAYDPLDAECWFNKGVVLKKLGRHEEAKACIAHSVNISSGP